MSIGRCSDANVRAVLRRWFENVRCFGGGSSFRRDICTGSSALARLGRMGGSASSRPWVTVLRVDTSPQSHMRNRSMSDFIRFVGLDVHADSITFAVAEEGRSEARHLVRLPNDLARLLKSLDRLGPRVSLRCAYEAGPTVYGLQRALARAGIDCFVIAPSKAVPSPHNNHRLGQVRGPSHRRARRCCAGVWRSEHEQHHHGHLLRRETVLHD